MVAISSSRQYLAIVGRRVLGMVIRPFAPGEARDPGAKQCMASSCREFESTTFRQITLLPSK